MVAGGGVVAPFLVLIKFSCLKMFASISPYFVQTISFMRGIALGSNTYWDQSPTQVCQQLKFCNCFSHFCFKIVSK